MTLVHYEKELLPSNAKTSSSQTSVFKLYDVIDPVLLVNVTAVSGTLPTLDIEVEVSSNQNTWFKVSKFARITATGQYPKEMKSFPRYMRLNYSIGGTDPSFTFDIQVTGKQ